MKEIAFQKKGKYAVPHSEDDVEKWANYKDNQIVKAKVQGFQKQRSIAQLGLMMACIKEVVKNTEQENWSSKDRAKLSLKALLNFVDSSASVVIDNKVIIKYRSFSFDNLKHMEACNLFDRAFPLLAGVIGKTAEELIYEAKKNMKKR